MAAPIGGVHCETLKEVVKNSLKNAGFVIANVPVTKRSNDFNHGDFCIPSGCIKHFQEPKDFLTRIHEGLKTLDIPVEKVTSDKFNLAAIHLERSQIFKNIIQQVMAERALFGSSSLKQTEKGKILVCNRCLYDFEEVMEIEEANISTVSLAFLRAAVLQQHTMNLLQANGYEVTCLTSNTSKQFTDILDQADIHISNITDFVSPTCAIKDKTKEGLVTSPYVTVQTQKLICDTTEQHMSDAGSGSKTESLTFNLKQYLIDNNLKTGKTDFDKNLSLCCVCSNSEPTDLLQEALALHAAIQTTGSVKCLHIVSHNESVRQQKVMILLHSLQQNTPQALQQKCFIYGPVSCCGNKSWSAEEYFSQRYAELRQAAVMKYGEAVHGEGWAGNLQSLTSACVKFEMLNVTAKTQVKLELGEDVDESKVCVSTGSFVMYNCARLATLFSHFEQAVEKGTYPLMPDVEHIDFSTLREEQEWSLLFNYVYTYPDLVRQTVQDYDNGTAVITNIHTHKICQMLGSVSRCLSSYYSRYHVLGEGREHLLPVMYARLYLLKAVDQVMENALALIGVKPLSQL